MLEEKENNVEILSMIVENKLYNDINSQNNDGDSALLLSAKSTRKYDNPTHKYNNFQCFNLY